MEQGGQRGWAGYQTDLPAGALLEWALVAVAAAVGPLFAGGFRDSEDADNLGYTARPAGVSWNRSVSDS